MMMFFVFSDFFHELLFFCLILNDLKIPGIHSIFFKLIEMSEIKFYTVIFSLLFCKFN